MAETQLKFYGALWCGDCRRSKYFLDSQEIAYEFIDTDLDAEASAYVRQLNGGRRIIPTIVFPDDSFVSEPTNAELTAKLVEFGLLAPA